MSDPATFLIKADKALAGAALLLERGDVEGATARAYYALHHAAKALLLQVAPERATALKTHAATISAFGLVGVRTLGLSADHGRLLNFAHDLRLKADYDGDLYADRDAVEVVLRGAELFLADVRAAIVREGDTR